MSLSASQLWIAWQHSTEVRELAEAWLTRPERSWGTDDNALFGLLRRDPDKLLSILFGIMQLTDDAQALSELGAGPFEDFLGAHGEAYVEKIHSLALEQVRLREVLDHVWQGAMPKHVWRRIELLGQSKFT